MMLCMGLGMVLSQVVIVPKSTWAPPTLLRVGTVVSALGFVALLPETGMWLLLVALSLLGLGLGIAIPGYMAGPTMLVRHDEQGGVAGVVGATNGLTYVMAPTLSTILYGWWQPLPVVISLIVLTFVAVFVTVHPAFRRFQPLAEQQEVEL